MDITRRNLIRWLAGGTAAAAATPSASAAGATHQFEGYEGSFGVLHDTTLCIGCRTCEKACNEVNDLPEPDRPFDDVSVLETKRRTSSKAYTVLNAYNADDNEDGVVYRKSQCNHCLEPACASACFVRAFSKTPEGAVIYDPDVCVGCRYCMVACPFNAPAYEYDEPFTPRVVKCTLCHPRTTKGKLPGCVEICPMDALLYGRRDHLIKVARERIRKYPERYVDHIYGEHEMGGTSWLYLSGVPFEEIGMRMNLGLTPAPAFTMGFLSVVPMVLTIWPGLLTGFYFLNKRREEIAESEKKEAVNNAVEKVLHDIARSEENEPDGEERK